jgi:hypothetical protein
MAEDIDERLRHWARWSAVVFAGVGGALLLGFVLSLLFSDREFIEGLFQSEVRAIVGIPLAALTAFCVVTILQATSGEIKFSGMSFTFEGASGPVVLWVMCFLAVVMGIVALWK